MVRHMSACSHYFQVLKSVVEFVSVLVVDNFPLKKRPAKVLGHDESVLKNPAPSSGVRVLWLPDHLVALAVACLAIVPVWVMAIAEAMALLPPRRKAILQRIVGLAVDASKFFAAAARTKPITEMVSHSSSDTIGQATRQ
jgi:hypothetical protein